VDQQLSQFGSLESCVLMKFLFTVQPLIGHFHAMAPLALALKEHGHEVAFATGRSFGPTVQRVGFQHFPCGLDFSGEPNGIFETLPEWEIVKAKYPAAGSQQVYGFIQALGPRMADDVIALMKSWRPNVIVRDPLEFGGYIAAEHYGIPHSTITWAIYINPKSLCPEALIDLRQRYALPGDPELNTLDRYLVFNFLPSIWQMPMAPFPLVTHRFCAPPFDMSGGDHLPDWIAALPDRPTIYATLGTTFNEAPTTFQAILSALSTIEVNAIITVGRSMDPAQFHPVPAHIHIERYIPQTAILPRCDAVLFHGGYNSLHSALWHGLPVVIMPLGAGDQYPTGLLCEKLGVGIMVKQQPPEPATIRAAVKSAIEQPTYRARAHQLQRAIKELPDLSQAVKHLEILALTRLPQSS
jgi:UDP:flavonoid glycosyltransferase YjiC (YdhE family)